MQAVLRKLAALEESMFPPMTRDAVKRLEARLGVRLPAEVVALYRDHGGTPPGSVLPARLLHPKEVARDQKVLESIAWNERVKGRLLFLWTDDQSNYAAVYADGPAKGKVCVIDHGSPTAAPRFGSVASFYRSLFAAHAKDVDLVELGRPARPVPVKARRRVSRPVKLDVRALARIARELESIPWLARVGEPRDMRDRAWVVVPERRALVAIDGAAWEHVDLEASTIVTQTLSRDNPEAYRHWNEVIDHARRFFKRTIVPALAQLDAKLPGWAKARDALVGSVYRIFAERYFLAHGLERGFYTRLRAVFEAGRVPVGFKYPARAGALESALANGTGKVLVG
jgi:hypothetical protein